jgi:G protein-coupled receptor kinase interacting protein 2
MLSNRDGCFFLNEIHDSNSFSLFRLNKSATKLNFIKVKYENLAFISRGKYTSIEELNQQLLASVRTNNYELTLRILSQGADANYRNQEDGNQCIHAAVLNNQIGQIELLSLYGADLSSPDRNGTSAFELAKLNGHNHIAERLLELQFELTDELSYFLCNKRPDHKNSKHFLIPDLSEKYFKR